MKKTLLIIISSVASILMLTFLIIAQPPKIMGYENGQVIEWITPNKLTIYIDGKKYS